MRFASLLARLPNHRETRVRARRACRPQGLECLEERALLSSGPPAAGVPGTVREHALVSSPAPGPDSAGQAGPQYQVREEPNITYTVDGGHSIQLDLYVPVGPRPAGGWPAVVAFPGGGWRWASRAGYGKSVSQLARYGYVVAVADYTYSSGQPGSRAWPADFEDARNAVRWVRSHSHMLGVNPDTIAAEGVSSGAYLANMLGVYPDGPVTADGLPADPTGPGTPAGVSARVQAVVDFYGPVDMPQLYAQEPRTRPFEVTFLGGTPQQVPGRYQAASVDPFVSPDDPPFYIVHGTADDAVPSDQSQLLAARLNQAGVPNRLILIPRFTHGFMFQTGPLDLLPSVLIFLDEALHHQPITDPPLKLT